MSGFDSQTQVRNGDIRGPLVDGDDDSDVRVGQAVKRSDDCGGWVEPN